MFGREHGSRTGGGGVAGVAAVVTAANQSNSVLLIEKSNIFGGLATLGLLNCFVPMCNGRGKQIYYLIVLLVTLLWMGIYVKVLLQKVKAEQTTMNVKCLLM